MPERILSFEAALEEVLTHAHAISASRDIETIALHEALGRILAEPVAADRDQPPFHRSTRDGYAVRAEDITQAHSLQVIGSIHAGEQWPGEAMQQGQAIEIMTGAPLPDGADAVLMVEHASLNEANILQPQAGRALRAGENVVPQGAEARAGQTLLPVGRQMLAAEIAVAASCGNDSVRVFARPTVAIIATGDELVELNETPAPWQIRNSNSYALQALVQAEGGSPKKQAIARDTEADLRDRIEQGRQSDLLLLTGGVSMGKHDLVEQVLSEAGAEFIFTGALIQPGKPIVFGRLPKQSGEGFTYFFGLPGNPVSTQVCFHLFAAPMLRALAGRTDLAPQFVEAKLAEDVKGGSRVTRFLPAQLESSWTSATVRIVAWQGSGDVGANARGNGYAVLPSDIESLHAGDVVRVLLR